MLNIKTLTSLKKKVDLGQLTKTELDNLANQCNQVKEKVREYNFSKDSNALHFTLPEAFRTIVYQSHLQCGEPIRFKGKIEETPDIDDTTEIPIIFSRPILFNHLKVLYWNDKPLSRIEFDDGNIEKVNHAPLELNWKGKDYKLLAEVEKKSFYYPMNLSLPVEIKPWLTNKPQDRTTLATALKRQGFKLKSLEGISLPDVPRGTTNDLGVWVMTTDRIETISEELGCNAEASQVTIWFNDGSYFKGTIISTQLSGMNEGIYGGLKRPDTVNEHPITTKGSIMDNYILVPWKASINRQQTDYANIELPVRAQLPHRDMWMKAVTGFPGYINQFNDCITSRSGRIFQKCNVEGYAGKVAVGNSTQPVQFIIRGPKVKNNITEMAWLFNPSLPVHTDIMKVKVQLIEDTSLDGNLIQLNTNHINKDWIEYWYMAYAGRDCDGDGFTLSEDKSLLKIAKHWSEIQWVDTTSFKSEKDITLDDEEMAIRTATERIRLFSSKIGIYDKCARRILRQDSTLMTDNLRLQLTEAIQRCISAQKKNSGADKYQGYSWLLNQLPVNAEDWLFENVHDDIDNVGNCVRDYLTKELYYRENESDRNIPLRSLGHMLCSLDEVKDVMPQHYQASVELLGLTQYPTPGAYRNFKSKGRQFWAKHQARADEKQLQKVLEFISTSRSLWSKSSNDEHGLNFNQTVQIITHKAEDLIKEVQPLLVIGAMLNYLNVNLLGHVLSVDNLKAVGLIDGLYLHINHTNVSKGSIIAGENLKHSVHSGFRPFIDDCEYRVDQVYTIGEKTVVKVVKS